LFGVKRWGAMRSRRVDKLGVKAIKRRIRRLSSIVTDQASQKRVGGEITLGKCLRGRLPKRHNDCTIPSWLKKEKARLISNGNK